MFIIRGGGGGTMRINRWVCFHHTGTTDAVQILWKGDSLQHVPSHGQISSGSGTVVEVSGIVVYRVERFNTGLYGTFGERSRCSVDIE